MITVIIPTLNEAKNISYAVRYARSQPNVSEVIVVDDGSVDSTPSIARRAGAIVVTSSLLGKGASIQDGVGLASNEYIVCIDGDMVGFSPDIVSVLTAPLFEGATNFCKAKFERSGGRVTTLTAIPLLKVFFPELAVLAQPLGGVFAAKRSTLHDLKMETDYGVDLGILIDLQMSGERILEVDVGTIEHESQPLAALSTMASQVSRTILTKAAKYGRLDSEHVFEFEELERKRETGLVALSSRLYETQGIALIDMDGTILRGRFIIELAKAVGRSKELHGYLDHHELDPGSRTHLIASVFSGIPKETFIAVASAMELQEGVIETVRKLRQMQYAVGIVTDGFQLVSETIRRRVFADFSVAHWLHFKDAVSTGEVEICPLMTYTSGCNSHAICKQNVLLQLCETFDLSSEQVIAIGDNENDICMLRAAGTSIAFQPKTSATKDAAHISVEGHFSDIIKYIRPAGPKCALKPHLHFDLEARAG